MDRYKLGKPQLILNNKSKNKKKRFWLEMHQDY